jgi:hypothetical protein
MRLNAAWFNFSKRGQAWDHFWQDSAEEPAPPRDGIPLFAFATPAWIRTGRTIWWGGS